MKYFIHTLFLLVIINNNSYSQVIVLSSRNFERVIFPNSDDLVEKLYFQNIAYAVNDYVQKFYKKENTKIIIRIYNTPYQVRIDDEHNGLVSQLISSQKVLDYGLLISLPDTGICISKIFNLIDLGFETKDSSLNCLKEYIISKKVIPDDCFASRDKIDNALETELTTIKKRFLRRIMRKYSNGENCISLTEYNK